MKQIFEESRIGTLKLKNRLIRSSTWENLADERGHMTYDLYEVYRKLAQGGVGLILTGYANVMKEEQPNPKMMGIYDDTFMTEYRKLTSMVHEHGGKIIMQIAFGGSQTDFSPTGRLIWGPSAVADLATGVMPTAMTRADIDRLVAAFGDAAYRVKVAGFDGVQIHGAHSYLLNQFLNPYYNRRIDEYGGSLENRARIFVDVYTTIRERVGQDFPVLFKINGEDFIEGGSTLDDNLALAKILDARGIDAIEVSGGTAASGNCTPSRTKIDSPDKEAYHAEHAARIAEAIKAPVILVGGLRSLSVIDSLLQSTNISHFSLSRPLLREPALPKRWQDGDTAGSLCISCNGCLRMPKGGNRCVLV